MYKRILLTLDGSALAEQAVPHAVIHAECFGAELTLLKVLAPLPRGPRVPQAAIERAEKATENLAREYLESIAAPIREQGIAVQVATVNGSPYEEIVRFAEDNAMELLVLATRGHSGLSRWLLGSVADRVVRGATVPVLLVQARKEQS
jgi:nucleotide-binding universal stress UspA family protein